MPRNVKCFGTRKALTRFVQGKDMPLLSRSWSISALEDKSADSPCVISCSSSFSRTINFFIFGCRPHPQLPLHPSASVPRCAPALAQPLVGLPGYETLGERYRE